MLVGRSYLLVKACGNAGLLGCVHMLQSHELSASLVAGGYADTIVPNLHVRHVCLQTLTCAIVKDFYSSRALSTLGLQVLF